MADVNAVVAEFVGKFGEEAVVTALGAYETHRQRSKEYAEKTKVNRAISKQIVEKAKTDPEIRAKLAELGITV